MSQVSMHGLQHLRASAPAWLTAVDQPLWVTRVGDPADHVLAPGERLSVARGDRLAVGAWHPDGGVTWAWQPLTRPHGAGALRRGVAAGLERVADALRHTADALACWAHRADPV